MERLTEKIHNTNCVAGCGSNCKYGFEYCRKEDWENCETISDVIDKLAEYEDLEEQGRLIKLPCKKGDAVYAIIYDYEEGEYAISKTKIIEIHDNCNGWFFVPLLRQPAFRPKDFGKIAFLTREEAEAKLKELQNN